MAKPCGIPGCDKPSRTLGWCTMHYGRWKRNGDPLRITRASPGEFRPCSVEGCGRPAAARGLCAVHYERWRTRGAASGPSPSRHLPPGARCRIEGCPDPVGGSGEGAKGE